MDYEFWQVRNVALVTTKYKTEKDAKAALQAFLRPMRVSSESTHGNEVSNYLTCPIMNGQCRKDCVSYKEHTTTLIKQQQWNSTTSKYDVEEYWHIRDWECRNVLINGVIGVEQL